ncbi:MAG TPA: nitroreductase, partial [Spirochaetota bacterium]|nr:nitroreductase [Spirochaetota bacterium]
MKTTRKKFITQGIYAGMALTGVTALISACGGIRRASLRDNENMVTAEDILPPEKAEILRFASLAPSGHNSQPWVVKVISPEEWTLCADQSRRLPAVDPDNRELLLSMGAFLENLSLAAGSLGYAADIRITARTPQDTEIARITVRSD